MEDSLDEGKISCNNSVSSNYHTITIKFNTFGVLLLQVYVSDRLYRCTL